MSTLTITRADFDRHTEDFMDWLKVEAPHNDLRAIEAALELLNRRIWGERRLSTEGT